uniref:Uncharacterized protein n=1 Tax=Setaria italica TaxID=4555 RepID=K4APD0_SETIT
MVCIYTKKRKHMHTALKTMSMHLEQESETK